MAEATRVTNEPVRDPSPGAGSGAGADLLFDAIYGAAFGGSAIALFFLAIDTLAGRPLFTPSLIGTVLFTDTAASAVTETRLDMVAYYSIVHFGAFGALGGAISRMCRWSGLVGRHAALVATVVFAILTAALFAGDLLLMPGVIGAIGIGWVLVANLITGVVMALFLRWAHGG